MWQLLGSLLASSEPALGIIAQGFLLKALLKLADQIIADLVDPSLRIKKTLGIDINEDVSIQILNFSEEDRTHLGLPKTQWTILLSDRDLGTYIRYENIALTSDNPERVNKAKKKIKELLIKGEKQAELMNKH